jgi:lysophospholipase
MGAHVALRLLAERAPAIEAAVLVSPMLALNSAPLPAPLARLAIGAMRLIGRGSRPAWPDGRGRASDRVRQAALTGSRERFADASWWKQANPELALGPPSWDWLAAANASQRLLDAPGLLERVTVPTLILAARHDRLVRADATVRAAARMPHATLRLFDDGAHELLREADPLRGEVMAAIDAFLDVTAPAPDG